MIAYRVLHTTTYQYTTPAEACRNLARLRPRNLPHQFCSEVEVRIEPAPAAVNCYLDYFGNEVHSFAIYEPHQRLTVSAESKVVVSPERRAQGNSPPWESVQARLRSHRTPEVIQSLDFAYASPYVRVGRPFREFAEQFFPRGRPLAEGALAMAQAIQREFKYDPQVTTVNTPVEEVLVRRHGVCQDFAHLQLACLRSLGLACRYVSGFLRTDPAPGRPQLTGADATHAWVSVYCPETGWFDLDPTNGCRAGERHITLGWGRDFHDVSPLKGVVLGGGDATLSVAVDVLPIVI